MEVEEKIEELENRVAHIEREVDVSYKEAQFERKVDSIFRNGEIESREGNFGLFARVTDINGDDVQQAIEKIDSYHGELDYAVTETADGLGMEVWDE